MCKAPVQSQHRGVKYCSTCRPKMKRLNTEGVTEFRTRVCCDCLQPRDNSHLKYDAGVRCADCERERRKALRQQEKHIRRARKYSNGHCDTDIDLQTLAYLDDGECWLCGEQVDWSADPQGYGDYPSIDHVQPLSKGGPHRWTNVALAHRRCNGEKGAEGIAPSIIEHKPVREPQKPFGQKNDAKTKV